MYYCIMRLAIITAVFVGLISSFYHLWLQTPLALNSLSPSFAIDETFFYAPKINQPLNNPGELVGSSLMSFLSWLTGSIPEAFVWADFIFPALTFLALYFFTRSVAVSVSVLVFYHYLTYFPYLPSVIRLLINHLFNGHYWELIRSFHPQISLGLFFVFAKWPNALTLTLLTYTHFYYWTAALVWLVFLRFGRGLIKTLTLWLALTLPYWFFTVGLLPATDYWHRNYFYVAPTPIQLSLLVFGFLLAWRKKYWLTFYLAVSLLVAVALVFKFGVDDPIGHWFLRVVNPMTAVLIFTTLFNKLKWPKAAGVGVTILLLAFQFRLHFQYFKNNAAAFTVEPEKLEAFNWLKDNTPKNSVVATGIKDSLYLPAYTNNQPYLQQAQLSYADNSELLQRFLQTYKLAGFTDEQLVKVFQDNPELIAKKRFDFDNCASKFLYFRLYQGADYYNCNVPETILRQILYQFEQTSDQLTYPADYWLGTERVDFGQLVWENRQYKIYQLNDTGALSNQPDGDIGAR